MSDCSDDYQSFVIDNGSQVIKAGFAGDDAPRAMVPSCLGRPRHHPIMVGLGNRDSYVGDEAQSKRAILSLDYPIKRGVVTDWDSMEKIWKHLFYNEVRVAPEEHPVLLTEPPYNPKAHREKMTEVFFESLEVPAFYVTIPAILSCYASGRGSAIMLDVGHGVSHILPVYEGYTVLAAIERLNIGGQDISEYLSRCLQGKDCYLATSAEQESLRDLKEKLCYTAVDYHRELTESDCCSEKEARYELPDGRMVTVGKERFQCPELLFNPYFIGKDYPGIHERLHSSLIKCDMDMRRDLYTNIVISGSTTLMKGFQERLTEELRVLLPDTMKVKVVAPPERKVSVWIGGSILASLSTFQSRWISREEYEEHGPTIVHKKCF